MANDKSATARGHLLVVEDDDEICRALRRMLEHDGHEVITANDGRDAVRYLSEASRLDVIVSDVRMPHMTGVELLRAVREHDLDLPVMLMTASPDIATAIEAIEYGAYRYLPKPIERAVLLESVHRAIGLRRMARLKQEALAAAEAGWGEAASMAADRARLEASFERALQTAWMAYQPIVRAADGTVFGYEALLRSREPSLPNPGILLDAAERLGRLNELGRAARSAAASPMGNAPDAMLFVNLHPRDLADETLLDEEAPLSRIAPNVVLEITERAALGDVADVRKRVARLRQLGFRLAVDDLGAGYAGLNSFATLEPEIVKLDMTLVRDIDRNAVKQKVVDRMTALAHELKILVVTEGVETASERDVLVEMGCDLMQGYLIAKPGEAFPDVRWRV